MKEALQICLTSLTKSSNIQTRKCKTSPVVLLEESSPLPKAPVGKKDVLEVLKNLCLESFGLVYLEIKGVMKNSDSE
jgi:hypothetical protein